MAPFVAPSSDLVLTIGDIERKVDMSLDDIIKQSKGMDKKHNAKVKDKHRTKAAPPVQGSQMQQTQVHLKGQKPFRRESQQRKGLQQRGVPQQRRDVLQKFVAMRSSALRQEKLAEARASNGSSLFVATKAAERQALAVNSFARWNRFSRKAVQGSRPRVAVNRSPKIFTAALNPKMLILNQLRMTGAIRRPAPPRVVPSAKGATAQPQRQNWNPGKMVANGYGKKPQTLDSRFASLREERQLQSQFGPNAGWRR